MKTLTSPMMPLPGRELESRGAPLKVELEWEIRGSKCWQDKK